MSAQRPQPTIDQLEHTAWSTRDGAPGQINVIEQTADGYLWLGTGMGLFRFDGIRFDRIDLDSAAGRPATAVKALLALPDGSLWVGYSRGGTSIVTGQRALNFGVDQGMPPGTVTALARDSTGRIWVATTRGIARLVGNRWQKVGAESGYGGGPAASFLVDRRGALWVAGLTGVYRLARNGERFVRWAPSLAADPSQVGSGALAEAPDGSVWGAGSSCGLVPLTDELGSHLADTGSCHARDAWYQLVIDSAGNAWSLGLPGRILRIPLLMGRARSVVRHVSGLPRSS